MVGNERATLITTMAQYDITALGSALEFDTSNAGAKIIKKLSDTRFVVVWQNSNTVKYVQTFDLNPATGALTANSSPLNFYSTSIDWGGDNVPQVEIIDATHFAIFWVGASNVRYCRTFQVNSGTGAVTTWGSETNVGSGPGYNTFAVTTMYTDATYQRCLQIMTGADFDGFAVVVTITLADGSVAVTGTPFEYDTNNGARPDVVRLSSSKALVSWAGDGDDGFARVLDVNNSTWAVTGANSALEWLNNSSISTNGLILQNDTSPAIVLQAYNNGQGGNTANIRQLSINTSTWAVSNFGTPLTGISGNQVNQKNTIARIDDEHVMWVYIDSDSDGQARTYEFDTSTGALSQLGSLEFETSNSTNISMIPTGVTIGGKLCFVVAWTGVDNDGFVQTLGVEISVPVLVTPDPLVLTLSLPAPTVTAAQNVVVSPAPLTATITLPNPTVTGGAAVSPSPLDLTLSLPNPTVTSPDTNVTPDPLVLTLSLPAPAITGDALVSPGVLSMLLSLPAPTVTGEASTEVIPSPLILTLTLPTPTRVGSLWVPIGRQGDADDWSPVARIT